MLLEILTKVLNSILNHIELEILLKDVFHVKHLEQAFICIVMNHLDIGHHVTHVNNRRMRKILSDLGPKRFHGHFDLRHGRERSSNHVSLLICQINSKVLHIGLKVEFFIGPEAVVHGFDEFGCPRIVIRFSGDLFVEYWHSVIPFILEQDSTMHKIKSKQKKCKEVSPCIFVRDKLITL